MKGGKFFLLLLTLVFGIALIFRFYKLSEYPVSLSMDEVAIGYNAYSILKTGMDEWGVKMPLAFRSVGDFKPAVDIYLTVPFIAIFGLTEFAVRAPVALLGSLTCVIIVLFLIEMGFNKGSSLLTGIWFAIVPWHVHFSRGSFEAVTALFFVVLGVWTFLKSQSAKSYFYAFIAVISFSLSVWAYHAERLFIPLFVIGLVIVWKNRLKFIFQDKKKLLIILIILLVFALPFLHLMLFSGAVKTRALSTSVFREQSLIKVMHNGEYDNFKQLLFDNDYYLIFRHIAGKYLNYFDLRFWFWKGMAFTPPGFFDSGLFYTVDLPLILAGIYMIWAGKNKKIRTLFLLWFFLGPLPAAFTMNEQHPLRALIWLPVFAIAMASVYSYFFSRKFKPSILRYIYIVLVLFNVLYLKDIYFRQFPRYFSEYWQYGYKQIALFACQNKDRYKNIVITDTFGSLGPLNTGIPYIYVLFYCNYDPLIYQNRKSGDIYNIKLRRINWSEDKELDNSLLVAAPWDFALDPPADEKIIKTIKYPGGTDAFIFVETK